MKKLLFTMSAILIAVISFGQNQASINITKNTLHESLSVDQSSTQMFTIVNKGESTLDFSVTYVDPHVSVSQPANNSGKDNPDDFVNFLNRIANTHSGVSWLHSSTINQTLAPNESYQVAVSFNASGLTPGNYNAQVLIKSNDPDNSMIAIPVLFAVLGSDGSRGTTNTAFTTADNEDNNLTGNPDYDMDSYLFRGDDGTPIEFNLFVSDPVVNTAQLSIYAWDIDETAGEIDHLYFNGHFVGMLTGADDQWSTSVFNINPAWVNPGPNGKNLVKVLIDVNNAGWAVQVDWGQLVVNGGSQNNAFIRYVHTDKQFYQPGEVVAVTNEIDTYLTSQDVYVETNLLDESMVNVDGVTTNRTLHSDEDDPFTVNLQIPYGSSRSNPIYYVQVIVYDAQTNIQQDIKLVTLNEPAPPPPGVPVSPWAIIFGIFLISIFIVFRYKRNLA